MYLPYELASSAPPAPQPVVWEETDCLLCGGNRWTVLLEAQDHSEGNGGLWFAVVQCLDCGLCFTNPRPTVEAIGRFYPPGYPPHQTRRMKTRRFFGQRHTGETPELQGRGRLLDFGCGPGHYLQRMSRQGWDVTGLDASAQAVDLVQQQFGLRALVGTLPHPELEPGSFDVITMRQSLEHVHHPQEVLRAAHRLLAPGGKLIVSVPNIDSAPFRWFGRAWYALDLPRHLTHFAPWTLQLMLQRTGFRPGPVQMVRHTRWLMGSADLACNDPLDPRWRRWLRSRLLARMVTWYTYVSRQADCMMVVAER